MSRDTSFVTADVSEHLKHFSSPSSNLDPVQITEVTAVASYSWIEAKTPTIAVPGSPGIWTNVDPEQVPPDSGLIFVDQNAHKMGDVSPLTPIFAAAEEIQGIAYGFGAFDLISDRNSLRKLIRWASGTVDDNGFKIDMECAGPHKTCLFTRRERQNVEPIEEFRGFGQEYQKAATRLPAGCEKTTGHHRIISINFGKLKLLLRFTADACKEVGSSEVDEEDLMAAFSTLSVSKKKKTTTAAVSLTHKPMSGLSIQRTTPRTLVPQSSLIEIKTRGSRKELDWAETYPQLYLSQTPYLYLARHTRGIFGHVEKYELTGKVMKVHARKAEAGMGKLLAVLVDILVEAKKQDQGVGMSLVCVGKQLSLYKRKEGAGMSVGEEILSRFV